MKEGGIKNTMLRTHKRLTQKELKKDPLVILAAQVVDFLRKEKIKIISTSSGVIIIVAISLFLVKGKSSSEINAFDIALNAYNNNAPEAMDLLSKFVDRYSGSKKAEEALIKLGNHYFAQKNFDSAEKYYLEYINTFSDNPIYGFNAYNGLAGIYEEMGDYRKAGEIYEEFIDKYKNSAFLSMMYLNAGKAYFLAGDRDAAIHNFNKIINSFGDSREKQEAIFYKEMLTNTTSGA